MAEKKITKVTDEVSSNGSNKPVFTASPENKSKAKTLRIIAILAWIVAIGFEIAAIIFLRKTPINMTLLIAFIVADLAFAVIGSMLWKKANRLDPASNKDKTRFFIQNQLGLIISIIAFLPLVILIFTNKEMEKNQKLILSIIAIVALGLAGFLGTDFNPPSQEQYAEQIAEVEGLVGMNNVFWTKFGTKYHIYSDCHTINTDRTDEIFEGTVQQARELKNITELCSFCRTKAQKEKGIISDENNIEATNDANIENEQSTQSVESMEPAA